MKTLLKSVFATALFTALMNVYAVPAQADTTNTADQNSTTTVNCTATSGDYGQSTNNCSSVTNQNIVQRNVLFHAPIATGADPTAMAAGMGAILSMGAGA